MDPTWDNLRHEDSRNSVEHPFQNFSAFGNGTTEGDDCCRLCCSDDCDLRELFPGGYKEELLLHKILQCTTVQISYNEDSDAMICFACVGKIEEFFQYREKCRTNDVLQRKWKRRLGRSLATTTALIPTESMKHEMEPEKKCFEAGDHEHIDFNGESHNVEDSVVPDKHSAFMDTEQEDYNLPEIMPPEQSFDNFSANNNENEEDEEEADYQINIKQEPADIDDTYGWNDIEDPDASDATTLNTTLIPVIKSSCDINADASELTLNCGAANSKAKHSEQKIVPQAADKDTDRLIITNMPPKQKNNNAQTFEFYFVTNCKGGRSLVYNGYKYCKSRVKPDGSTFWRCRALSSSCSAGLQLSNDNQIATIGTHNHPKTAPNFPVKDSANTKRDLPLVPLEGVENEQDTMEQHDDPKTSGCVLHCGFDFQIVRNSKNRTRLRVDGNSFVRDHTRDNGVVTWRCRKNNDKCAATALQYRDGTVDVFGTHDHAPNSLGERCSNSTGTWAYKYESTAKGSKALIVDGYRYFRVYLRADRTTLWRCAKAPRCKVKASLEADGKVYVKRTEIHRHGRTEPSVSSEDISRNRRTNKTGTVIRENENAPDVADASNISHESNVSAPIEAASKSVPLKHRNLTDYHIVKNKKGFEALVHGGYRYCKVRVRQDGSIKWLCKMNRKTCHAGLNLFPDGRLEWLNKTRHNHVPTHVEQHDDESKFTDKNDENNFHIDEKTFVTSEWYFVRNNKKGTTLVHADYRYTKKGDRTDMTSMWRCSRASAGCRAAILMYPNETIGKLADIDHNHAPPPRVATDILIYNIDQDEDFDQSNNDDGDDDDVPESSVLESTMKSGLIEEQEDPDANMRSLLNLMLDVPKDEANPANGTLLSATDAGYRFIKNRRQTESLLFRGYRYCKNHNPRADGSLMWVCQMNKKTCRATIKMLNNKSIVLVNVKHNHSKLEEDVDMEDDDDGTKLSNDTLPSHFCVKTQDGRKDEYNYYYAINRSNRECLIFQQCRYSKSSTRTDGSVVWRCLMGGGTCTASAIVYPDGACVPQTEYKHNHPPLVLLPDAVRYPEVGTLSSSSKENATPKPNTAQLSEQSTTPSPQLCSGYDGKFKLYRNARGQLTLIYAGYRFSLRNRQIDGTTSWRCRSNKLCTVHFHVSNDGTILPTGNVANTRHNHVENEHTVQSREQIPLNDEKFAHFGDLIAELFYGGHKSVKTHAGGKSNTLTYGEYVFKLRAIKPGGREYWRCTLFQAKACRAALFCRKNGKIVERTNGRPHTHKPTAYSARTNRPKPTTASESGSVTAVDREKRRKDRNSCTTVSTYRPGVSHPLRQSRRNSVAVIGTMRNELDQGKRSSVDFSSSAYRIVAGGGQNDFLYYQNNLFVSCGIRVTDGAKLWRCSQWQGEYCCMMELAILTSGELENRSDSTHNHSPTESDVLSNINVNGTRNFKLVGRNGTTIACLGHRYCWLYQTRDNFSYYRCIRYNADNCRVVIKMDSEGKTIFPHAGGEHNHASSGDQLEALLLSTSNTRSLLNASRGFTDYRFERTIRGVSLHHRGHRYWAHNTLAKGWTVYRCRMQKLKCPAIGYFNPDLKMFHLRHNTRHNHNPLANPVAEEELNIENKFPSDGEKASGPPNSVEERQKSIEDKTARTKISERALAGKVKMDTENYSFVKGANCKFMLLYESNLYEFDGKTETPAGTSCINYSCQIAGCTASLNLLASGLVKVVQAVHKPHALPDLIHMNDMGCGSSDFRMLQTCNSSWIVLYQGHRYYSSIGLRLDGSSRWYCQTMLENVAGKCKIIRKKCYVPLDMLPNGRVATSGEHKHPRANMEDDVNTYMMAEGKRFRFQRKLRNNTSVWGCVDHLACGATIYRLENGRVQAGRLAHSHTENTTLAQLRGESKDTSSVTSLLPPLTSASPQSPLVVFPAQGIVPNCSILPAVPMSLFEKEYGRRSFWYGGNRFYFYLTRADGTQYWRCSWRIDRKCRAGILRLLSGHIVPHNNEPHSHPDQSPGRTDSSIPVSPGLTKHQDDTDLNSTMLNEVHYKERNETAEQAEEVELEKETSITEEQEEKEENEEEKGEEKFEKGTYNYKIINGKQHKDMFLKNNGAIYYLHHKRHDGGRIYRCRKHQCQFKMLLRPNGELVVQTSEGHNCDETNGEISVADFAITSMTKEPLSVVGGTKDSYVIRKRTSIEAMEVEDPEDFLTDIGIQHDDSSLGLSKHIRLAINLDSTGDDNSVHDKSVRTEATVQEASSSTWIQVEQEEVIESTFDNDDERACLNQTSANHNSQNGEENDQLPLTMMNNNDVDCIEYIHHSDVNHDDESSDESSESHSKGNELVVSAEPHESYARKAPYEENALSIT